MRAHAPPRISRHRQQLRRYVHRGIGLDGKHARNRIGEVIVPAWRMINRIPSRTTRTTLQANELRDHPRTIEKVDAGRIQKR